MANEQVIDQVIAPVADTQVVELTELLKSLDIQMVANIKSANALNAATGNSKSFSDYTKNATAAALATEKIQQAQNKTAETTVRLNTIQAKAAADEQARIDKQIQASQRRQQQSDKEATTISAGEAKKNEALAKSNRAFVLLNQRYQDAIKNAKDIGAAQGATSQAFIDATENVGKLEKQVDAINTPLGDFKNKIGGYANGITDAFSKTFGYIRTLAYILPGIGLGGIFSLIFEGLGVVITKLTEGSFALDQFSKTASALGKAFEDAGFKSAIGNVIDLKEQITLAKEGIIDQDVVLKKYNETIGQTVGQTDSLDKAEQLLVANSGNYIKSMFYKAAAAAALAEGTDDLLKATKAVLNAQGNQQLNDKDIAGLQNIIKNSRDKNEVEQAKGLLRMANALKKSDDENLAQAKSYQDKLVNQTSLIYDKLTRLANQYKVGFLSKEEQEAQADRTKTAIDYNKSLVQSDLDKNEDIANDDKKSYSARYAALKKILADQIELIQFSQVQELGQADLTKAQEQDIIDKSNYEKTKAQQDYIKRRRDLDDKAAQQDLIHLKNTLQAQKDAAKLVLDNPDSSLPQKETALDGTQSASKAIIEAQYKDELRQAGDNAKSIAIAVDNRNKAIIDLEIQYNADYNKILQDEYAKQLAGAKQHDKDLLNSLTIANEKRIQDITDAAQKEIEALDIQFEKGGLNTRVYEAKRLAIITKSDDDILKQRISATKFQIDLLTTAGQDSSELEKKLSELKTKQFQDTEKKKTEYIKQEIALRDQLQQASTALRIQAEQAVIETIQKIGDANYENQIAQSKKESELVDKTAAAEKKAIDGSILSAKTKADRDNVIDVRAAQQKEQLANQQKKIQAEEAEFNKEVSVLNVLVATAEAVGKIELQASILAANPLTLPLVPLALAQIPIAIASGAIQEAAILATPLPKFAKGGVTSGGNVVWGEAGTELATLPDGTKQLSTGTAIANFPKDTVITPHMELMQMIRPNVPVYSGGEKIGWKEVVKAIKDNKQERTRNKFTVNVDTGYENYKRSYLRR